MNGRDYIDGLFINPSISGINSGNNDDKIINEAIILDKFGGDRKALLEFYSHLGHYGYRDGILNENAAVDLQLKSFDCDSCADTAAVLCAAKNNNCKDYDIYCKCVMLMQKCMDNMKKCYGNIAKDKVELQKNIVESNPRVQDAIEKTVEACDR